MSRSLLLAAPSVPSPTRTPAASISVIGATPDAIFMFDVGLWMTPTLRFARIGISSLVGQTTCAAIVGPSKKPIDSYIAILVVP